MPSKTKQETNREYFKKKQNETHMCPECNIPVKFQSRQAHLKTKKHLENCKKQRSDFLDEFEALNEKRIAPKANLTEIFRQMYYLIQAEYFNDNGTEILTDEERWKAPKPLNSEEADFCDNTGFAMRVALKEMFDTKIRACDSHKLVDEWEAYEKQFEMKNYEDYDAKVYYLTVFRALKAPLKEKDDEDVGAPPQVQVKIIDSMEDDKDEDENEEEEQEEDEDYGNDTYEIDETNYITCHFPPLYQFRDLKKSKQEIVLEEIAVNCAHVFDDDKRVVIERIYEALSARDKLMYIILYDDIYAYYKRYTAYAANYHESESASATQSDEEQEMFEYDFKY